MEAIIYNRMEDVRLHADPFVLPPPSTPTNSHYAYCLILLHFRELFNFHYQHHFFGSSFLSAAFSLPIGSEETAGGGSTWVPLSFYFFSLKRLKAYSIISSLSPFFLRKIFFCTSDTFSIFLPSKKMAAIEISFSFSSIFFSSSSSFFFLLASAFPIMM